MGHQDNADNMPPYELPTNQTQSGIKSHSTKGGGIDNFNEIRFEDKKGEESVNIQAEKDMTTLVKNNQTNTIKASRSSSTGGNDSVSVGADRSLSVTGTNTITVTKSDTEDYKDTRTITVKGPDELSITNAHTGNYKAARTLTIKGPDKVTVESGGKENDVTGKYWHKASVEYEAKQGENVLNMTGSIVKLTNGKSTLTLNGGKITMEAPDEIEIKVGGNSIKLASAGTIDVTAASTATMKVGGNSVACSMASVDTMGQMVNTTGTGGVSIAGSMIKIG